MRVRNYDLTGPDGAAAIAAGKAGAAWFRADVPREAMKELMQRRDGPALRDTALWIGLLIATAAGAVAFAGSWLCVPFFAAYGVLYGSASDSRWHECGHGTAFRTRWMNAVVYQIACFMMVRSPTVWRRSHQRHHADTIIVGRDPEINCMRPPSLLRLLGNFVAIPNVPEALGRMFLHASGRLTADEATFVPADEVRDVFTVARVWVVIHAGVVVVAVMWESWLPVLLVGPLPSMYGAWFGHMVGLTQHAGLAEDVLDHRLNSRTVRMNPLFRFLYWNMNYHVEHHMFASVPFHALPRLHELIAPQLPPPYASTWAAYREIVPAVWKQRTDPDHFVRRELPGAGS
jgi:fatty acid desaturase